MNYNKGSIVISPTFCNIPHAIHVEDTGVYLSGLDTNTTGGYIEYTNKQGGPVVFKLLHNQRRTVIQQFNNQLKELGKEL